ncbi:hypothetical protein FB45DRAFT_950796 [Roridomyces roridus]|uniref:Uncharacterized protein n=1 Tax=Roridomyces roridus TaxID=1738132 RepID=A0AAD7B0B5_9AGAR|nr:hypothetical protein FB45DRAFT_950796 [Roridomyces roridus]
MSDDERSSEDLEDPDWSVTLYAETLQFPRPPASPSWSVSEADTSLPATPSSPTFPLQPFRPLRITKRALSPGAVSRSTASSFSTAPGVEDEEEHRRAALHHATLHSTTSLVRSRSSSYNPPQSQVDARRLACGRPSTADAVGSSSPPFIPPRIQPLRLAKRAAPDPLPMHTADLIALTHAPPPPRCSSLPPGVSDAPGRAAAFSRRLVPIQTGSEVSLAAATSKGRAACIDDEPCGRSYLAQTVSSTSRGFYPPAVHPASSCKDLRGATCLLEPRPSPTAATPSASSSYRLPSTPPRSPTTARSPAPSPGLTSSVEAVEEQHSPSPVMPPHSLRRRPRIMIPNAWTQRVPPTPPTPPPSAADSVSAAVELCSIGKEADDDEDAPQLSPLVAPPLELFTDDGCVLEPEHPASSSVSPSADSSADWTLLSISPASSPARPSPPPRRPLPPPPVPPKADVTQSKSAPALTLTPALAPLRSRWSTSTLSLARSVSAVPSVSTPAVQPNSNSKTFTSLRRYMYFTSGKDQDYMSSSSTKSSKTKYKPLPFARTLKAKRAKPKPLTVADVRVLGAVAGW